MTIRPATVLDVDALVFLNEAVQALHAAAIPSLFRTGPPAAEVGGAFRTAIEDPAAVWLLAEDGRPCGFLHAQFQERQENWCRPAIRMCYIHQIGVHSQWRRKGVARQLVAATVAEAEKRGIARIELDVWSFNQNAREAFRRLGFQVFNERMELKRPDQVL
jgi:ribosomal protein S18 acetylase RimI-like enzyme